MSLAGASASRLIPLFGVYRQSRYVGLHDFCAPSAYQKTVKRDLMVVSLPRRNPQLLRAWRQECGFFAPCAVQTRLRPLPYLFLFFCRTGPS
jgi:hypothetical protein